MKRMFAVLLGICLMLGALPFACAEDSGGVGEPYDGENTNTTVEGDDMVEVIPPQKEDPVKVSSYEELEVAVAGAGDGDIIEISSIVSIGRDCIIETGKHITLKRADDFTPTGPYTEILSVHHGGILKGFEIIDTAEYKRTIELKGNSKIIGCSFDGENLHKANFIDVMKSEETEDRPVISNCTFTHGQNGVYVGYGANAICESCDFIENSQPGVYNCGNLELLDCTITENFGGGILAYGSVTLTNCNVYGNILADPVHGVGTDFYVNGTLAITNVSETEDAAYYDEFTGDKIGLPYRNEGATRLIYLQVDEADEYFAAKFPPKEPEEENPPENGGTNQPSEDTEDKPQDNTENPPPNGTTDKPTDDTQQKPLEPADGGGSRDDDYTPPIDYRPSKRPTKPSVTIDEEQEQPENPPAPDQSPLACNGATIDVSRSVVLLGYGDGLIHEDDFLTRAQMATIIFRLLDDDSIALYRDAQLDFADVPANAWYTDYVRVIKAAGIVNGIGGGRYDPDGLLTWGQTLAILSRFVEPQEYALQHIQYNGWASQAVQTAVAYGWIEDSTTLKPNALISRGQLEELLNYVLAQYR